MLIKRTSRWVHFIDIIGIKLFATKFHLRYFTQTGN